jgi:hypothetical protein
LFRGTEPTFSRGHGDTGKAKNSLHRFFSASPRLRENIGFFPDETPFSRRAAEARRNAGLSASGFSPCPRGSVSATGSPDQNPDLSQSRQDAKNPFFRAFLRAFAALRESGFVSRNRTDFLTGTRRHGEGKELSSSVFLRVSAPPREHRVFSGRNPVLSQSRGGAEKCRAIRLRVFSVSPWLRERNWFSRPKPRSLAKPPRRKEPVF